MKAMKKFMVMTLVMSMIIGLVPMNSMAFINGNGIGEYCWTFEDVDDASVNQAWTGYTGVQIVPGTSNALVVRNPGGSMITTDPAPGGTQGKVLKYTSRQYSGEYMDMTYAYGKGRRNALSFDLYLPASTTRFSLQWQHLTYYTMLYFNGVETTSFGDVLKNSDETNYLLPKDKWVTITVVADDTKAGQGLFASLFIDGVCFVNDKRIGDNIASENYNCKLVYKSDINNAVGTTFYIDEIEARNHAATFNTAPTVSIDADHQGENVTIDKKDITLTFAGGTDNLMDTRTYSDITVKADSAPLSNGTDYTLSYTDTKNVKLSFANDLLYGKTYTVSVPATVKNLGGKAIVATDFTFKAENRPQGMENDTPVVNISNIVNNTRFSPNETIPVTVNVTDADEIASIALFVDGSEVETITSGNSFTLQPLSAGTHIVVAKATDKNAEPATGESAPVTVIVKENTPTQIGLSVSDNHVFYLNGNVNIKAQSIDPDGEALSDVDISVDGEHKAYNVFEGALTIGTHTVKAEVTDSRGNKYAKIVTVDFEPQYHIYAGGEEYSNYGLCTNDSDKVLNWAANEYITYGTENVGGNYGNAMYLVSSDTSPAGRQISPATEWLTTNLINVGIITYDIMAEDVSKQNIIFPSIIGEDAGQFNYTPTLKIINGVVTDTANGKTYGSIESGKWYNITAIYDWLEEKVIISIGGHLTYEKSIEVADGVKYIRRVKPGLYETIEGGSDGKKLYVDNFRDYTKVYKSNKIKKVESLDIDGDVIAAGKHTSELTAKFKVTMCAPFMDSKIGTAYVELLKNGAVVGSTYAVDPDSLYTTANQRCSKGIIVTPSEPLDPGATYTIRMKPGFPSTYTFGTVWSDSNSQAFITHDYNVTVNSERIGFTACDIVDAQTDEVIENFADLAGADARFSFTCYNSNTEAKPVYAIVGVYNGDKLVSIKVLNVSIASGTVDKKYETEAVSVEGGNKVQGFLWMDTTSLMPYGLPVIVD